MTGASSSAHSFGQFITKVRSDEQRKCSMERKPSGVTARHVIYAREIVEATSKPRCCTAEGVIKAPSSKEIRFTACKWDSKAAQPGSSDVTGFAYVVEIWVESHFQDLSTL